MKEAASHPQSGFTLVEMLVVLFLFTIILVACSDIFIRTQRAQYHASGMQRLQDDARYVVQKITQDIHTGSIDYACYGGGACGEIAAGGNSTLALISAQGRKIQYKISEEVGANACSNEKSRPCILVSDDDGATWQGITQDGVSLDAAKSTFRIAPDKNPFAVNAENAYLSNQQPRVTIQLEMRVTIRGARIQPRLGMQTTVATREYKR